jgi:hypothetical protein
MDWTVAPFERANHSPTVVVNGVGGTAVVRIDVRIGQPVTLDAAGSRDPDGHKLSYRWFHYPEAGFVPGVALAAVTLAHDDAPKATVTATALSRPNWLGGVRRNAIGVAHIVLAVTDDGSPPLTSYRRVIMHVGAEPASKR